jgi:hypothetical protein
LALGAVFVSLAISKIQAQRQAGRFSPIVIVDGVKVQSQAEPPTPTAPPARRVSKGHRQVPTHEASAPIVPTNINARVLVINAVRRPWSDAVTKRVSELTTRLSEAGIRTIGESPAAASDDQQDIELAADARMVLDRTQMPVDAAEAAGMFAKWFSEKQPEVEAVLWIAPVVGSEEPRIYLFTQPDEEARAKTEAIKSAVLRLRGG